MSPKKTIKIDFNAARFISSATNKSQFPLLLSEKGEEIKEIALVGRSNVGKSSLINHLTQHAGLARVSKTPGKTQLINFFIVDQALGLVDLPGYGFAKVAKEIKEKWEGFIQEYLEDRKSLYLILLLIDIRHPPSSEDLRFLEWAIYFKKKVWIVFTKTDKLNPSFLKEQIQKNSKILAEKIGDKELIHVSYCIKDGKGRSTLIKKIQDGIN